MMDTNSTIKKPKCEICHNYDEFSMCSKCFQRYRDSTLLQRKMIKDDKFDLQTSVMGLLNRNYQRISTYNKLCLRQIKIAYYDKVCTGIAETCKIKQNLIIAVSEHMKQKQENIQKLKDIFIKENHNLAIARVNLSKGEESLKAMHGNLSSLKAIYLKVLFKIVFINSGSLINISDYFEINEYVKPSVNNKKSTNDPQKDFENIINVLSITESGHFIRDDMEFNYDELSHFKISQQTLQNKFKILKLNQFIFSLSYFIKTIAQHFGIDLPFHIEDSFKIRSNHTNTVYNFYINPDIHFYSETEVMQGYNLLNADLKFISEVVVPSKKSYNKLEDRLKNKNANIAIPGKKNSELSNFLSLKSFLCEDLMKIYIRDSHFGGGSIENLPQQKDTEVDGFVVISDYYN